jgi:hypothetical protein
VTNFTNDREKKWESVKQEEAEREKSGLRSSLPFPLLDFNFGLNVNGFAVAFRCFAVRGVGGLVSRLVLFGVFALSIDQILETLRGEHLTKKERKKKDEKRETEKEGRSHTVPLPLL